MRHAEQDVWGRWGVVEHDEWREWVVMGCSDTELMRLKRQRRDGGWVERREKTMQNYYMG